MNAGPGGWEPSILTVAQDHARVGFENNLQLPDGATAPNNSLPDKGIPGSSASGNTG